MKKIQILAVIYIFFLSSICVANESENLQKLKDLYDDNILTNDDDYDLDSVETNLKLQINIGFGYKF